MTKAIEIVKDESNSFGNKVRVIRQIDLEDRSTLFEMGFTYPEGEWKTIEEDIFEFIAALDRFNKAG